jgi:hypothetical protein
MSGLDGLLNGTRVPWAVVLPRLLQRLRLPACSCGVGTRTHPLVCQQPCPCARAHLSTLQTARMQQPL